jgi:glycosyltransferase involved in cell wall biosynthesis
MYDAVICIFGRSFHPFYRDLQWLKFFGKKIIMVYNGSDIRPCYIDGAVIEEEHPPLSKLVEDVRAQKIRIKQPEKIINWSVTNKFNAHLLEKPFISNLMIGIPLFIEMPNHQTSSVLSQRKVRVLHCPSARKSKGTPLIRAAVQQLQQEGLEFEFVEISGKPHHVVLQELQRCDFVVDQVFSYVPMAGFAVEAALYGKPAVVGGYAQKDFYDGSIPEELIPPSYYCHPSELLEAIRTLICDREYREQLGRRAREFVIEHWNPARVARRFVQLIQDDFPREWLYDPKNIRYTAGYGIEIEELKKVLKQIITEYGVVALQLSDKPELERKFVEFANSLGRE